MGICATPSCVTRTRHRTAIRGPLASHLAAGSLACLLVPTLAAFAADPAQAVQPTEPQTVQPAESQAMQPVEPLIQAAQALLEDQASHYPQPVEIRVDAPRTAQAPACTDLSFDLIGSGQLQSRTTVRARCRAPVIWTLYLQAHLSMPATYFVANRRIRRGETLSLDDLDTREGDLLRHPSYMTDPSLIIDWIATRPIGPGAAIESGALRAPDSIELGQAVQTRISGPGFTVTSTGHAVESGNPGSTIRVRTPNGNIVMGTVIDGHWVHVPM